MAEDDEGRRKHRSVMKSHDELVALELPYLVGDGFHFKECVTVKGIRSISVVVLIMNL